MTKTIKKEVAVIDVPEREVAVIPNHYDKLIDVGFETNADLERMERLFDLKRKHEENEARKAYFDAFAEFSRNPPEIKKSTKVKYQNKDGSWTEYNHADCGNALTLISKHLAPHGLSITFKQKQENSQLKVTCFLTHRLGYQESTSLSAAPDTSGGKNGIQGTASTDSYLKRYTAFSITGLHAVGEDDDGRSVEPVELITEKQESQLVDMILNFGQTIEAFCKLCNVAELKEIPKSEFKGCVASLTPPKE